MDSIFNGSRCDFVQKTWLVEDFVSHDYSIVIPDEVMEHGRDVARRVMTSLGNKEYQKSLFNYFNVKGCVERLLRLEALSSQDPRNLRTLEIGAGLGLNVVVARKMGIDYWGIEPGAGSYCENRIASEKLFEANSIPLDFLVKATGEECASHFPPSSFDAVVSFSVLEHVTEPWTVIEQVGRLLKPGGTLFMTCSNHNTFKESHYGSLWLPFVKGRFATWLVKLNGRNPSFLDELFLIRPRSVKRWLNDAGLETVNLFFKRKLFETDYDASELPLHSFARQNPSHFIEPASLTRDSIPIRVIRQCVRRMRIGRVLESLGLHPMLLVVAKKPARDKDLKHP